MGDEQQREPEKGNKLVKGVRTGRLCGVVRTTVVLEHGSSRHSTETLNMVGTRFQVSVFTFNQERKVFNTEREATILVHTSEVPTLWAGRTPGVWRQLTHVTL